MRVTTEELQLVVKTVATELLHQLAAKQDKVTAARERLRDAGGRFVGQGQRIVEDTYELADAYEVLGEEVTTVFTSASKVPRAFDWMKVVSPQVRQFTKDCDLASIAVEKAGGATGAAARGTRTMGMAAFEASRGLQDIGNGLGGVIDN